MSGTTTTVFALVSGAVFLALILPIFFDAEFPTSDGLDLADKALCFILTPQHSTNATCTIVDDTFTFLSGSAGLTVNATGPKELTWTITGNGSGTIQNCANLGGGEIVCTGASGSNLQMKTLIGGTDITLSSTASEITIDFTGAGGGGNITDATSLGGAAIFKQINNGTLEFRGITVDNPLSVVTNTNDLLLDLINCADAEIYVFNGTVGDWECQTPPSGVTQLGALSDVTITTVMNGDHLVFNSTSGVWENQPSITSDEDVQIKEGGSSIGVPRHVNFVDVNDFIILEDVGSNEIDIAINRDGVFGIPGLDSTGLLTWVRLNFTLSDIHDLANVTSTGCADGQILEVSSGVWVCAADDTGAAGPIGDLTDVTITAVSDNNVLQYNSTTGDWENVNPSDMLQNFFNCGSDEFLEFNTIADAFQCIGIANAIEDFAVDFVVMPAGAGILQTPIGSAAPAKVIRGGTNYDVISLDYDDASGNTEQAVFIWIMNDEMDGTQNMNVTLNFATKAAGGGVCWDVAFSTVAVPSEFDSAFGTTIGGCETSLAPVGDLNQILLEFTPAQHGVNGDDAVIMSLIRDTDDASDTNGNDAEWIAGRVEWFVDTP